MERDIAEERQEEERPSRARNKNLWSELAGVMCIHENQHTHTQFTHARAHLLDSQTA